MTQAPRTFLNRLLLTVIILMAVAIFALGGAIIWKLFLSEPTEQFTQKVTAIMDEVAFMEAGGKIYDWREENAGLAIGVPADCELLIDYQDPVLNAMLVGESCKGYQIFERVGRVVLELKK